MAIPAKLWSAVANEPESVSPGIETAAFRPLEQTPRQRFQSRRRILTCLASGPKGSERPATANAELFGNS
jgi:hypothetical protein